MSAALLLSMTACLDERSKDDGATADTTSAADTVGDAGDTGPAIDLLALGKACVAPAECASGHCALPCTGYGVCAPKTCKTDGDCTVEGSKTTHCCIDGRCDPIAGATCGKRDGKQGASCGGGGQTDCAKDMRCLDGCLPFSYCAASCTDNASCTSQGSGLACFKVVGDGMRCVKDPEGSRIKCKLDKDCPANAVCGPSISFSGAKVRQTCQKPAGKGGLGTTCGPTQPMSTPPCQTDLCFSKLCSATCITDADCACNGKPGCMQDQTCLDYTFTISGAFKDSARLCYPAARCDSSSDCAGKVCVAWPGKKGWESVCMPAAPGTGGAGTKCAFGGQCASGACHGDVCRDVCKGDSDCTGGAKCTPTELIDIVPKGSKIGLCI